MTDLAEAIKAELDRADAALREHLGSAQERHDRLEALIEELGQPHYVRDDGVRCWGWGKK